MIAEIIAIGSEVVSGRTLDTNSQFISKNLNALGIDVYYHTSVDDNEERLKMVFQNALSKSDIIVTCGGLGPTKDDLSKNVLAEILSLKMIYDENIFLDIKQKFEKINKPLTKNNSQQAYKIEGSEFLKNNLGTAPGIFLEYKDKIIIMLPGPPRELKGMFQDEVIPKLQTKNIILSKSIKTIGLGESMIETILLELNLETINTRISTYAKEGMVEIQIISESDLIERNVLNIEFEEIIYKITSKLKDYIYGFDNTTIEESILNLLRIKNLNLGLCESCTGGLISSRVTKVSGASDVFDSGIVTYSNPAKMELLNVNTNTLDQYGAVSEETAREMARGLYGKRNINIVASVTGIAGPKSDDTNKPVGLVYICIKTQDKEDVYEYNFYGNRESIQIKTATKVFELIWKTLN